ncbi:MAG: YmdB family metallophosphoesterase [Clostridia bacterium]|nr:YmdB family metallophosphoesterase [Clostridia bacterium]
MKILVIGDVTSQGGIDHLQKNLWRIRKEHAIDFCVVNGENASFITGISEEGAKQLLLSGADVITGGNHTMQNRAAYTMLEECPELIRPINFGSSAAGRGYTIADANGYRILVINALGNVHIEPTLDNPYPYIDRVLQEEAGRYDFSVLDIHAEATGEKLAIGYAYDGKINVIFGTHTHVPTADGKILPNGTGYITDVGMCGESGGVLGMRCEAVVLRMRTRLPIKFQVAEGAPVADGVIFELNTTSGRVTAVKRISF